MTKRLADAWHALRRPTLRRRMTLWTSLLLILTAGVLVAFITVATTIGVPRVMIRFDGTGTSPQSAQELQRKLPGLPPEVAPQGPLPNRGPRGAADQAGAETSIAAELDRYFGGRAKAVLGKIRLFSLTGLGIVIILGVIATYWVTGIALRPVQLLGERMRDIDSHSLATRLPATGANDELKALTDTFNHMLERLDLAFQQQRTFAADSAHELRTPLAILRTNLEVVRTDPSAGLEDYRATARVLERTLARLEQLVANLLTLSQTEERGTPETVTLGPLLEDIRADLAPLATEHAVTVTITGDIDATVTGDPSLLTQAFSNLLENAIHYNRHGERVTISIATTAEDATIAIADHGPGIPPTAVPHIFDRFYRIDRSRSRHAGGSGLGLAIVRHIVNQHDGSVEITHSSPTGTTFTVQLPKRPRRPS